MFLKKEVKGMPDHYGVRVTVYGGGEEEFKVVDHRLIDKVYAEGKIIGVNPQPFWEFYLAENNVLKVFPVGACTVAFDGAWHVVKRLREEFIKKKLEEKANEKLDPKGNVKNEEEGNVRKIRKSNKVKDSRS